MSPLLFVALCALSVAGLLVAEHRQSQRLKWLFKPAASLFFILVAIAAGTASKTGMTPFGLAILAGLVLCALGDVLLIPKAAGTFLAGMAAFAAGHAAYIAAFFIGGVVIGPVAIGGLAATAAAGALLVAALWRELGSFRVPVIGYCAIISVMVAASLGHWRAAPDDASAALALAAIGFAASDISVARDRFGGAGYFNRAWGLPLYFAAQCLFALNV